MIAQLRKRFFLFFSRMLAAALDAPSDVNMGHCVGPDDKREDRALNPPISRNLDDLSPRLIVLVCLETDMLYPSRQVQEYLALST